MIRKHILKDAAGRKVPGLDLESLASFEISSEDAKHPIDNALREDQQSWRAAEDGEQTIRITFDSPQTISRIGLCFEEITLPAPKSSSSLGVLYKNQICVKL